MRIVKCTQHGCYNNDIPLEVPSGPAIVCGPCGAILDEQEPSYIPPSIPSKADTVRDILSTFTDEDWEDLRSVSRP